MNLLIKDGVLSSRLINAIFGSLLIIPVYLFTKRIFNRKEAYIAAILTAGYTILIYSSTLTYNDSLYSFLFLFGLYFNLKTFIVERKKPTRGYSSRLFVVVFLR